MRTTTSANRLRLDTPLAPSTAHRPSEEGIRRRQLLAGCIGAMSGLVVRAHYCMWFATITHETPMTLTETRVGYTLRSISYILATSVERFILRTRTGKHTLASTNASLQTVSPRTRLLRGTTQICRDTIVKSLLETLGGDVLTSRLVSQKSIAWNTGGARSSRTTLGFSHVMVRCRHQSACTIH